MSASPERLMGGIDLGGTKVLAAVVDAENRILGRGKRPTPPRAGAEALAETLQGALNDALAAARVGAADLAGIGIGSPGPLDADAGTILYSANLAVKDFPIVRAVSEHFGIPALVRNDVRVGGYGEFRLGAGRGFRDLLAVFVGTGIGGCLILDGRIVEGTSRNAGEIGHIPVKAGGPRCGCGNRGCLEALASRSAIARRIEKASKLGEPTVLKGRVSERKDRRLKSGDLAEALFAGDAVAVREVNRSASFLGRALGGLINLIAPQRIILGGGVVQAIGPQYLEWVERSARQQAITDPNATVEIVASELGDDAGVLGAALFAREQFQPRNTIGEP